MINDLIMTFSVACIFQVLRQQQNESSTGWMGGPNNRLFEFPASTAGSNNMDWSLGLIQTNHHIFGSLAQQ